MFDGKKTSVWVGGLSLPPDGAYTIEFWIKPDPQVDGTVLAFAVPDADGVGGAAGCASPAAP